MVTADAPSRAVVSELLRKPPPGLVLLVGASAVLNGVAGFVLLRIGRSIGSAALEGDGKHRLEPPRLPVPARRLPRGEFLSADPVAGAHPGRVIGQPPAQARQVATRPQPGFRSREARAGVGREPALHEGFGRPRQG
jgi:hypothetical protein